MAASNALLPASCCSRANVTSRMEFAEATPTAMIAPIREGTFNVVPVTNNMARMPQKVAGSIIHALDLTDHLDRVSRRQLFAQLLHDLADLTRDSAEVTPCHACIDLIHR